MAEKPKSPSMSMSHGGQEHCCEICGLAGLSDDAMLEHMKTYHIDGCADCPFCGLNGVAPAELLLHVNQAHLDYLTPENELMSFIDDQSPRYNCKLIFSNVFASVIHKSSLFDFFFFSL